MTVTVAAVTSAAAAPAPLGPPASEGTARPPRRLLDAVIACLPAARDRAALLLPPLPRVTKAPARWRLAEAILEHAAVVGGGALLRSAAGGTLLLGASSSATRGAAEALGSLTGAPRPLPIWRLPRDTDAILSWAAAEATALPAAAPPDATVAGMHQVLHRLRADTLLRADRLLAPDGTVAGHRLRLSRRAIAAALGPLAADPDLLAHAMDRMAARLLPGLAAWAADVPDLRLIPLPQHRRLAPAQRPGAVAILPVAALSDPRFATHRQDLAERGWGLGFEGLDAAALRLLDPLRLPAALVLLRWSAELVEPGTAAALRALRSTKVVLTGAPDGAARQFAQEVGLLLARPA